MKYILPAAFIGAALCLSALAQDTSPSAADPAASQTQPAASPTQPSQAQPETQQPASTQAARQTQPSNTMKIAPGSVIPVQLGKTIDAKKAKTGDEVVATVTQDMKTSSGEVLVPKDTKVIGHVTEAQARNKEQKQSEVGIAFDHAVVKGDQMQLPMSIQAIIAPQPTAPTSAGGGESPSPDTAGTSQTSPMSGRSGTIAGATPPPPPRSNPQGGMPDSQAQAGARPAINGNTQGVIGMPDVKLESSAQNAAQGSVLSSEKNNVKIEKGTLMLLRVSQ